jgi:hypothetical protein
LSHLWQRPRIRVVFGPPIAGPGTGASDKATALRVTAELDAAMRAVRLASADDPTGTNREGPDAAGHGD